jgi:STE24 endopeptidase
MLVSVAFLIAFVWSGGSASLRDYAGSLVGASFIPTLAMYAVLLALLNEAISLPFAFYEGVTLERRYGLSTQTTARWWLDHLKAGVIVLAFGLIAALIVCSLIRWQPDRWWVLAAVVFTVIMVGLVQLTPVLLLPLFYEFKPLDREALVRRLVTLAERAGGQTRRIIISDTLLAEHSDDEIEVILAHELAHHVHRDIWKGIALETVLIALGFYLADAVLARFATSFGLTGKGDIAALPLLLLAAGAVSLALMPLANAFSRAHERRADRYALEMTRNVPAFVSAMKRLGAQNLAEERPSRLVQILFYTHPPISARIDAAQAWAKSR